MSQPGQQEVALGQLITYSNYNGGGDDDDDDNGDDDNNNGDDEGTKIKEYS